MDQTHPSPSDRPWGAYAPTGLAHWIIARTRALPPGWLGRRLLMGLRRIGLRALRGQPVDIEALGARMRLHPYANICEKKVLFAPQMFDPVELQALEERLREGFVFVDIGANVGAYSLFVAARAGGAARILAIEPQPHIFDRLVHNIRLNPFHTVKAVACAVADKAGELTLFLDPRNSGESSVKILRSSNAATVRVPATTLLDLVTAEGFDRIDAVKIDVEGAEDIILEPFLETAPEALHPRLLIVEDGTERWQADLPGLLARKGYRLKERTRLNLIYERG